LGELELALLYELTEEDVQSILGDKIFARAMDYYTAGRVQMQRVLRSTLTASVQGAHLYNVHIEFTNGSVVPECTCPDAAEGVCKHAGAVLLQWVNEPQSFSALEPKDAHERRELGRTWLSHSTDDDSVLSPPRGTVVDMAGGENDPIAAGTLAGTEIPTVANATDGPAETSLANLLKDLSLADLRAIARQRGWRITGNSIKQCAEALAPLMSDPTQVARAVNGIPEGLRETVRAAFVAEDGGGLTPTILAQTLTALRPRGAAEIKPVEAGALLTDLSRWGLVVQWHDTVDGRVRYLFPWEVQRHVPPLPGWCPPAAEAGTAEPHRRERTDALDKLYRVWEQISRQGADLRPLQEPPQQGRLRSLVEDWTFDPEEIGRPLANGRRQGSLDTPALTVPAVPFMLTDEAMATLLPLTDGDQEQLEFVCRLLHHLDLVAIQDSRLTAQPVAMSRFLRQPTSLQARLLAWAYLSLLQWSELDMLLRRDSRLRLWRRVHSALSQAQFRSLLIRLRHLLLRFLATAGESQVCGIADVETPLQILWPEFPAALLTENHTWLSRWWGLSWRRDGQYPVEAADWHASQGAMLRVLLEGPLYWLGIVELYYKHGALAAFRACSLGDWIWDRPSTLTEAAAREEAVVIDGATGVISVHPRAIDPQAHVLLGRIANLTEVTPRRFVYRLDRQAAYAGFEGGASLADLLQEWQRTMPVPVPAEVSETLGNWWKQYGQVRLYDGYALLELSDDLTLQELLVSTSLGKQVVGRLSSRLVLVPEDAVATLLEEFASKGYTPKEVA